jgi:hypothetical protein
VPVEVPVSHATAQVGKEPVSAAAAGQFVFVAVIENCCIGSAAIQEDLAVEPRAALFAAQGDKQ